MNGNVADKAKPAPRPHICFVLFQEKEMNSFLGRRQSDGKAYLMFVNRIHNEYFNHKLTRTNMFTINSQDVNYGCLI